jgi:hypothetical protein
MPAKTMPAKTMPAKTMPAKTMPAKTMPAKSAQPNATPAKSGTTRATPAKSATSKGVPAKAATVGKAAPAKAATAGKAAPAKAATAGKAAPAKPAAAKTTSKVAPIIEAARSRGARTRAVTDDTAEQPQVTTARRQPVAEAMIIVPPAPHDLPPEAPQAPAPLAAGAAAAHAAAVNAVEAELRRTGGSVTQTRGPGAGTRPAAVQGIRPPTAPRAATGQEFIAANAGASRGVLLPGDAVIHGTIAGDRYLSPATKRMYQRRRRVALIAFLTLAVLVLLLGQLLRGNDDRAAPVTRTPAASALVGGPLPALPTTATTVEATRKTAVAATAAATGPAPAGGGDTTETRAAAGTIKDFRFVAGYGPVLGTTGTLRRFKVAVQKTVGQGDGGDFNDEVDRILGDPRSWIAGHQFRLQRVPQSAASEFTIFLASAKTSARLCEKGGLVTGGFTSCRLPGQVIMNLDRWDHAVPDYPAPLETYRAYAINHEVGHQLGHGHEACLGKGRVAPVMMQQTYGLNGCVANAWPYVGGKRYVGVPTA